jgi:hypothetical protein
MRAGGHSRLAAGPQKNLNFFVSVVYKLRRLVKGMHSPGPEALQWHPVILLFLLQLHRIELSQRS